MPRKKVRVAVLCGGPSNERDVSLKSGEQVIKSLPRKIYNVSKIEITKGGRWLLGKKSLTLFDPKAGIARNDLKRFDVIFIALHGKFGEDGRVQAILDVLGVPYTGSGTLASALGMHKEKTNEIIQGTGVLVPKFVSFSRHNAKDMRLIRTTVRRDIGYPCVVKPNESGSSVGITIVQNEKGLEEAVHEAFLEDASILIQKYIRGKELTCAVMGNSGTTALRALPIVEIIPDGIFFDYNAKYFSKKTREICPANVNKQITREVQELSKIAHQVLGCDGLTRSDFILTPSRGLYFLEINTIPGLTEASLCPKEAKAAGINFGEFLDKQVKLALKKFQK